MTRTKGVGSLTRRAGFVAVAALAITALAGCSALGGSDSGSSGGNGQVEKAKIKVAVIPGLIDIAGYKRAQAAGYFKAEGLDVEDVSIKTGADAPPLLINKSVDFAFGNWTSALGAQAKGTYSKVGGEVAVADALTATEGMTALVALPSSNIKSPKDLKGKKIGVNALKSNVTLTSDAVLAANGLQSSDVTYTKVPTADALNALTNHLVDVMSLQEPNLTQAKQKLGVVTVADRATGPVANFPVSGYVSTGDFVKANPKTVAAFQRAVAKGQADMTNRQTLEDTLLQYTPIDKSVAKLVVAGVFPTVVDKTRLQRLADLMLTYKIIDNKLDVSPMFVAAPAQGQ
ncbi:ABC transporter substrate-binding protein [Labedaea rhizosphaerae]|uniref:NitT/TauT family transport system substrate-binding protein n=1 Tax=Labedaea rhizosphaerae TaxID=598644 RepID=A0A4R6SL26_LABRH|nr:ABC transporter substrate-binding protein [Labedaea rhizosphaerae]TDQ04564.1 NitT/TauT family transport system substrate-binding protein [Labedaea rhizosphaerae]